MRRVACGIAAATAAVCAVAGPMAADDPGSLEVLPAQGSVYVLAAAGGNTTVQIGSEGPLRRRYAARGVEREGDRGRSDV